MLPPPPPLPSLPPAPFLFTSVFSITTYNEIVSDSLMRTTCHRYPTKPITFTGIDITRRNSSLFFFLFFASICLSLFVLGCCRYLFIRVLLTAIQTGWVQFVWSSISVEYCCLCGMPWPTRNPVAELNNFGILLFVCDRNSSS